MNLDLEPQLLFQKMSPLVALTVVLVAVSATPNKDNHKATKNSVSKVGQINPFDFLR